MPKRPHTPESNKEEVRTPIVVVGAVVSALLVFGLLASADKYPVAAQPTPQRISTPTALLLKAPEAIPTMQSNQVDLIGKAIDACIKGNRELVTTTASLEFGQFGMVDKDIRITSDDLGTMIIAIDHTGNHKPINLVTMDGYFWNSENPSLGFKTDFQVGKTLIELKANCTKLIVPIRSF